LSGSGVSVIRYNLTDLRHRQLRLDPTSLELETGEWTPVDASTTVWWHRSGRTSTTDLDPDEAALVVDENAHLLVGMLDAQGVRWVDNPDQVARAERKLFQLARAGKLGFATPAYCVTNNASIAREFSVGRRVVTKALSPGIGIAPYTAEVHKEDLQVIESNPTLLQELVEAFFDLRVIVVGGEVWIWSRPREDELIDWRASDPHGLNFEPIHDQSLASSAVALTSDLGLTMSVQDWLGTEHGPVFLEVNPQGAWLFLSGAATSVVPAVGRHLAAAKHG
jgi:glutathione synthase/RimK-type ligase-like ATP-grasp enzyme